MKWEEICAQYAGQWPMIEYQELDEPLNVVAGEVVVLSPDDERRAGGTDAAAYTG